MQLPRRLRVPIPAQYATSSATIPIAPFGVHAGLQRPELGFVILGVVAKHRGTDDSTQMPACPGQDAPGLIVREDAMRPSAKIASAAVALVVLLPFSAGALSDPKEEVAAATLAWGQALGQDEPEKVLPFYSDDAA